MVTIALIMVGLLLAIIIFLLGWLIVHCCLKWSGVRRRTRELLHAVLTCQQYRQLNKQGFVDIPSPSDPERFYRVPQSRGRVEVIEKGKRKVGLCLQPLEWIPDADIVVIHKLMIEADEETYLHTANSLPPLFNPDWQYGA